MLGVCDPHSPRLAEGLCRSWPPSGLISSSSLSVTHLGHLWCPLRPQVLLVKCHTTSWKPLAPEPPSSVACGPGHPTCAQTWDPAG